MKNRKGFTLVELLAVIAILAILVIMVHIAVLLVVIERYLLHLTPQVIAKYSLVEHYVESL